MSFSFFNNHLNYKKIKQGEIFLIQTDTVVGIGGIISDDVKNKILKVKKAPRNKKLPILISSIKTARIFEGWSSNAEKLAKKYWPGPLTIITTEHGLRMPKSRKLLRLISKVGPIYMTSANLHNQPPLKFHEAVKFFQKEIPIILKNRLRFSGIPSTVIKPDEDRITRKGEVFPNDK